MKFKDYCYKLIVLVISVVMVFAMLLPTTAFAAEKYEGGNTSGRQVEMHALNDSGGDISTLDFSPQAADDYIYVPASSNTTAASSNARTYPGCSVLGNPAYKNIFTEQIYLQSELGNTARSITQVSFCFMNTAARTYDASSFKIYMGMTSTSSIAAASGLVAASDMKLVYDKATAVTIFSGTSGTWVDFDLDTDFEYTGTGNLAVAIVATADADAGGLINTANQTNAGKGWMYVSDSAPESFASYSSASVAAVAATTGYTNAKYTNRPSIRLGYETCNHANAVYVSTTAATCEAGGYDTYHCPDCDKDIKKNETAALGHDWPSEPSYLGDKDGTKNENGKYNVYVCKNDSTHFKTESADATVWDGAASAEWTKGSGTQADPYLIESAANLAYLRDQVNAGAYTGTYAGTYFKQMNDIDLSEVQWSPIGRYSTSTTASSPARAFSGHYDGGGHTISGLKVDLAGSTTTSNNTVGAGAGLFGFVKGSASDRATIENLVVEGNVNQTTTGNSYYVAGLAGYTSYTDIKNCGNDATVTSVGGYVAGITGNAYYSTIEGCYNHGNISATATGSYAGGIAAAAMNNINFDTRITNCYNTGNITNPYYGGGIVGAMYGNTATSAHTYENCYNSGTITSNDTGTNAGKSGGIVGTITTGSATAASGQKITNCWVLAGSAPCTYIGGNLNTYMTITDSGELTDSAMKAGTFVKTLGSKYIAGADYPVLYWEAPEGIPTIDSEALDDAAYVKDATDVAALSVTASGDPASGSLAYQWYKASKADLSDAAKIDGATTNSYTPAVDAICDAYYYCTVNNDVQAMDGSGPYLVQSSTAHIQVWSGAQAVAPIITQQPTGIDSVGQTEKPDHDLAVVAQFEGSDENDTNSTLTYQWQVSDSENGPFTDVEGATTATWAAPTDKVGTKYYRCVVTTTRERQSKASTTSDVVSVTVEGIVITTLEQLNDFATRVDNGTDYAGLTVTLGADIMITGAWNPIGASDTNQLNWKSFKGEFDGGNHAITFACNDGAGGYYALFAATGAGAYIHDLVIDGAVKASGTTVAGVVAQVQGTTTLERVGNNASVESGSVSYATVSSSTAGLVGMVSNGTLTITECYNKGDISASGVRNGGLVGNSVASTGMSASTKITSSYNTGNVTTSATGTAQYTGGIIGYASPTPTVWNCYNTGTVATSGNTSSTGSGAVIGCTVFTNPTGNNVCYWLDTSNARGRAGASAQPAGLISKTVDVFADENTDDGATGMLALLNVGDYNGDWIAGSTIDPAQASPALHWEYVAPAATKHTVTFDPDGGTLAEGTVSPAEVEDGATIEKPADPTNGTTKLFDGWYNGDEEYDFATPVTDDLTLTAKWSSKRTVTITVQSAPADVKMVYTDEKTGESTEFAEKQIVGANTMFLSTQNPGAYYGTHDAKVTVSANGYEDYVIESPGKEGTNNISKSFKMTPLTYTITYNLDEGTNADGNPATYTIETADITLSEPTKDNYTFQGWFDNADFEGEEITTIAKGSTGNKTLYAKWTLAAYTITYDLDEGELEDGDTNPATYNIESDDITLKNPVKEGFVFNGWTGTDLDAATKSVIIEQGSTGNREYKATWLKKVAKPTAKNNLTYNGEEQAGIDDADGYTLSDEKGKDAAAYTAKASLDEGYIWEDETTDDVEIEFSIAKATLTATYAGETINCNGTPEYKVTVTGFKGSDSADNATYYVAPAIADDKKPENIEAGKTYEDIVPSGGNAKNYDFNYVAGTLTVNDHDFEFADFTWTGDDENGYTAAVANYVCKNDEEHTRAVDAHVTPSTTEASCEKEGKTVYTATVAADDDLEAEKAERTDSKEVTIAATGHDWGEPSYTWSKDNSTVTATRTCKNDSNHEEIEEVDVTTSVTTEPKCEDAGVRTYTSGAFTNEAFDVQTKTEAIDPTGHTEGDAIKENEKAATCTKDGSYDEVVYCEVCGAEISRESVTVPKTGHKWGESKVITAATCEEQGLERVKCENDPDHFIETVTPALGHDLDDGEVTTEPTCTKTGIKTYKCTRCDHEETETIPALGHDWGEGIVTKEATCTEDGILTYTCSRCGDKKTENIPATGHIAADEPVLENIVNPTCDKDGSVDVVFYCKYHGDVQVSREEKLTLPKVSDNHTAKDPVIENEVTATCTKDGSYDIVVYCAECGAELSRISKTTDALGHNAGVAKKDIESEVAATCEDDGGYDLVTKCETCGEELSREHVIVEAIGHDWDDGVVTTEPTDSAEGVKTFTCKNDPSHTKAESIPKVDKEALKDAVADATTDKDNTKVSKDGKDIDPSDKWVPQATKDALNNAIADANKVINDPNAQQDKVDAAVKAVQAAQAAFDKAKQNGKKADTDSTVPVTGISLDKKSATPTAGDTVQLKATVTPSNATNKGVTWKSSDPSVASVDQNGKVTTKKAGTATITATTKDGNKTATCKVTVKAKNVPVSSIKITPAKAELATKKTLHMKVEITPSNATNKAVTWKSSDPSVAKVDANGKVTAIKYGKPVTITATTKDGKKVAKATIQTRFYDVNDKPNQYYWTPVYWAADNNITKGYTDNKKVASDSVYFGPQQNCTRKEMIIFLWRLSGKPSASGSIPFSDTKSMNKNSDGYKAILWGVKNGIIKGYEKGKFKGQFRPDDSVARKDTLIMLYRLAKKPSVSGKIKFPDVVKQNYKPTSDTYKAILWGTQKKITNGYNDGNFRPFDNCLREHIVTFIYRYAKNVK